MTARTTPLAEDAANEPAEVAYRRIARRKLIERGCPCERIEGRIAELMRKGASLRVDAETILDQR